LAQMETLKPSLYLTYSHELPNGEPLYISSNCLPIKSPNLEPAGHAFHSAALLLAGISNEEESEADSQSVSSADRAQDSTPFADSYSTKGKKKSGTGDQQQDHYALLGLGHLRFLATEDQIRKSYREMALKHHPDKQAALLLGELTEDAKQKKKDEIETHFKAIQEAYEVLIDPIKRRIYDSTDEFDDDIPTDCAPKDFFKVFGPAFMRNGRWSVNQPIPSLGDDCTPLVDVDKFYDFWYTFKSWREFPHADEYDLEQAESREHKRWMERQNAKLQEKARKVENARIRTLVDNAYRRDPRIIKRKEMEKAEKQRKKEAKYLAKRLQEEEAARAAEEEKLKKEEAEKLAAEAALNQKRLKEKEKKLLRKEKTRLRSLAAAVVSNKDFGVSESDVEIICGSFGMEQLRALCDKIEGKQSEDVVRLIQTAANKNPEKPQENGIQKPDSKDKTEQVMIPMSASEKKEKPWGKEEIEMLRKGVQKYPKGTSRRWEVISEYIGTGRSVDEILKATKTVLLQKPDSGKAFDSFLEKRKPAPTIASPLSTRAELAEPAGATPVASSAEAGSGSTNSSASAANGFVPVVDPEAWSETQERALIQALKAFPKDASQRWERVAAAVPGKTVVQCKKKFALMKESFRSKKNAE
jgi:DnaJ homolog subfamily C member 2